VSDDPPEVIVKPQFGPSVTMRFDCLVMPLEQPLSIGEAAVFLGVSGGRHPEDLCVDILRPQVPAFDLR
jgi:hypothetical protein